MIDSYKGHIAKLNNGQGLSGKTTLVDKITARVFLERLNLFGLNLPKRLSLPESFVMKPRNDHSCNGVIIVRNGVPLMGNIDIVEELLVDINGDCPPRDFKFYCFSEEVKVLLISDHYNPKNPKKIYLNPKTLEELPFLKGDNHPERTIPSYYLEMVKISEVLSGYFKTPVRVDLYATPDGIYFGEFCVQPGIIHNMTPEADRIFTSWWNNHEVYRRDKPEKIFSENSKNEGTFISF